MGSKIRILDITDEQRKSLERLIKATTTEQRIVRRAHVILCRADGQSQEATSERVGIRRSMVVQWERRFMKMGISGLKDAPGRGRKPTIPLEKKEQIILLATQPPPNKTRWSVRSLSKRVGVAPATVQRIWAANDIKPHLTRTFKLSTDPDFEAKFWDVIGLYLDPPCQALVLCCDEKSQCQALERTQPSLPLGIGHIKTKTHDYIRHGTVTLFAALNYLNGKILSTISTQHTHVEWLKFLKKIHRDTPKELALHLIVDNYATHKHPTVREWIKKHPRMHMHYTPTGSSWMNLVERFFRQLTDDVVREGSFTSIAELTTAINIHLAHHNVNPSVYRWKAEGSAILAKIQAAKAARNKITD